MHRSFSKRKAIQSSFLVSLLLLPSMLVLSASVYALEESAGDFSAKSIGSTVQILGAEKEFNQFLTLSKHSNLSQTETLNFRACRLKLIKKILLGYLDVRSACSKIDTELAYTYELSQKCQNKVDTVSQLFNFSNFVQGGALYIIEGRSKLHKQDKQSYILTTIGSGLSAALPAMNIIYGHHNKIKPIALPKTVAYVLDSGPVDGKNLPETIEKFLDSSKPGESQSRRSKMAQLWKQRYKVDLANQSSLCSLTDGKSKSPALLKKRILLLWSLHSIVEEFDSDLLSLLEVVKSKSISKARLEGVGPNNIHLSNEVADIADILKVKTQVKTLTNLRIMRVETAQADLLEEDILPEVLFGALNAQIAIDKIDSELNYAFDVVLAELTSRRSQTQQRITEANFINKGTLNAIGGTLDLKGQTKAANDVFISANGIGISLSSLALVKARGGKRHVDVTENSLSDIFSIETKSGSHIPSLVNEYLNSNDWQVGGGATKKDTLFDIWKRNRVSTLNLNKPETQRQLASCSNEEDTIKVVVNRIALLQSLRVRISAINTALLKLLVETECRDSMDKLIFYADSKRLSKAGLGAADLLGLRLRSNDAVDFVRDSSQAEIDLRRENLLLRLFLKAALEVRATSSNLEIEIARESQALNRMIRARDLAITVTNNANFFQSYILGIVLYGPLGLSASHHNAIYADRLKIISGFITVGLGVASLLERRGGIRFSEVSANMLGPCFNLNSKVQQKYYPLVWNFLNSISPGSPNAISRREELISYWQNAGFFKLNLKRQSTIQKLSAMGMSHSRVSESINLISMRISMLYDLRAVVNLMNIGLSDLLRAAN